MFAWVSDILWWHWVAFGVILVVLEIIVPQFVVIWFGLSAIVVGVIDKFAHPSFTLLLAIWIVLSLVMLSIWLKFFKPKSITDSGMPEHGLHTKGVVKERITPTQRGKVIFETPVLGSSEWSATSDEVIEVGEEVSIKSVHGQLINVKKLKRRKK